jgi:predicted nucleic-acid-binding Zn-ribbon protein
MGFPVRTAPTLLARVAQEKMRQAMEELRKRHVNIDAPCPRCKFENWNVDLMEIPATSMMTSVQSGGFSMPGHYVNTGATNFPVLSIVCQRCGYTVFHNLQVLGISLR